MTGSRGYYHHLTTKVGTIGVDTFPKEYGVSRGRCREWNLRLPLTWKWTLELSTPGRSYRELVGAPKELENIDWVIDEFDANFNALAVASLRYHLNFSVCDNSAQRGQYEDLIERLSETCPHLSPEQNAAARSISFPMTDSSLTAEQQAALDQVSINETEWLKRQDQARHDFVDIMRGLWS